MLWETLKRYSSGAKGRERDSWENYGYVFQTTRVTREKRLRTFRDYQLQAG